jgi:hypothetical protein
MFSLFTIILQGLLDFVCSRIGCRSAFRNQEVWLPLLQRDTFFGELTHNVQCSCIIWKQFHAR